jgi:hypothetical protein
LILLFPEIHRRDDPDRQYENHRKNQLNLLPRGRAGSSSEKLGGKALSGTASGGGGGKAEAAEDIGGGEGGANCVEAGG